MPFQNLRVMPFHLACRCRDLVPSQRLNPFISYCQVLKRNVRSVREGTEPRGQKAWDGARHEYSRSGLGPCGVGLRSHETLVLDLPQIRTDCPSPPGAGESATALAPPLISPHTILFHGFG